MPAIRGWGEWRLSKSWLPFPQHSRGKSFYRLKEGATCRNNTVSSDKCHLDTVTDWFSSFQLLNCDQLFVIPWTAVRQASLSITNSWSSLKLMSIKSVMPLNHLILYHPLLLPPSIFPCIRVFSSESILHIRSIGSIGISASTSVLPMNTQDWSTLGWTGWISLQSNGLSRVFSNTTVQKHQFFGTQLSL